MLSSYNKGLNYTIIFCVLLIAALFRLHDINVSYWGDEALTHQRANGTFYEAITSSNFPLYNVLAYFSLKIDDSEVFLRLPSFIAGCLSVLLIYFISYKKAGPNAALISSSILALSVFHIEYSQDARYYALLLFFVILTFYLIDLIDIDVKLSILLLWALIITLGVATHPFFIFYSFGIVVGLSISIFIQSYNKNKYKLFFAIIKISLATCIGFLPYLQQRIINLFRLSNTSSSLSKINDQSSESLYFNLSFSEYNNYILEYMSDFGYLTWYIIIPSFLIGIIYFYKYKSHLGISLFAGVLVSPVPLFFIEVSHWYTLRYFSFLLPILIIASATGLSKVIEFLCEKSSKILTFHIKNNLRAHITYSLSIIFILFLIVPSQYSDISTYYKSSQPMFDWKNIAKLTSGRLQSNDILYLAAGYHNPAGTSSFNDPALRYYLEKYNPNSWTFFALNDQFKYNGLELNNLIDVINKHRNQTIWIISNKSQIEKEVHEFIISYSDEYYFSGNLILGIIGEPTINLLKNGNINPDNFSNEQLTKKTNIIKHKHINDQNIINISLDKPDEIHAVRFPVVRDNEGNPANKLKNNTIYTLSFQAKLDDIQPGLYWSRVCKVIVYGERENGSGYWGEKLLIRGSHHWKTYKIYLIPGKNIPSNLNDVGIALGLFGGTGSFQFYNVQLEKKHYNTPFTEAVRNREFISDYM